VNTSVIELGRTFFDDWYIIFNYSITKNANETTADIFFGW